MVRAADHGPRAAPSGLTWTGRILGCAPVYRYVPLVADPEENNYACQESTTLFLFSTFLYISGAVVFSLGRPYRRSIFSNRTAT